MTALLEHLIRRLGEVQVRLGLGPGADPDAPFAELVDSMGLVEFVGLLSTDCAVRPALIEEAVGRRFTTLRALADALHAVGIAPQVGGQHAVGRASQPAAEGPVWLTIPRVALPEQVQPARDLDGLLNRPSGWLEQHAGIVSRRVWGSEDALQSTTRAALSCLHESATPATVLAALLVTSEAPPRPLGLAAALHARMGLPGDVPALEIGGACTGLLHSLWLGRRLARPGAAVLLVAVEAPSSWLAVCPGPKGENAALFGDAAGACLLSATPQPSAWPVRAVVLGCDGSAGDLIGLRADRFGPVLEMDGPALAVRAVQLLAAAARQVGEQGGLKPADLEGVFVHAGNGRLPALLARQLGVPGKRVRATTAWTGNLGSVSLLAALAHQPPRGPAVCAAVGAGLCWGAVLLGPAVSA